MNRSQGVTTSAAIILAVGPSCGQLRKRVFLRLRNDLLFNRWVSPAASTLSGLKGDGPWIASCQYWAAVRAPEAKAKDAPANISLSFKGTGQKVDSHYKSRSPKQNPGAMEVHRAVVFSLTFAVASFSALSKSGSGS
jgi:hypothetical protein